MKSFLSLTIFALQAWAPAAFASTGRAPAPLAVSVDQTIDEIVSIFENETPDLQYDYIDALGDGRGYTAGRAGFTTATGDLLEVVRRYEASGTGTPSAKSFTSLLPILEKRALDESGDLTGLGALPALWKTASLEPEFRAAQDTVAADFYRTPAAAVCKKLGFTSPLSLLIIYDTIVQHGDGSDDDALPALLKRTPPSSDEETFMRAFLKVRRADLLNPANSATAREWRESVDRVDALTRLIDQDHWDLALPLRLKVWGRTYAL